MKENTTETFITSDIGIAAYLQLKGFKLLRCERRQNGRFHFEFEEVDDQCKDLSFEFLSSDFCKFDNIVRNLKKVLFS
jgi:hypothetical protein|tara:strand:+ start:947 stop:1180 length:234 start_codon:yes stop_codon:yes gene_type:complete